MNADLAAVLVQEPPGTAAAHAALHCKGPPKGIRPIRVLSRVPDCHSRHGLQHKMHRLKQLQEISVGRLAWGWAAPPLSVSLA